MSLNIKKTNNLFEQTKNYLNAYNKCAKTNFTSILQIKPQMISKDIVELKATKTNKNLKNKINIFFKQLKSKLFPSPPKILNKTLGENNEICKDITDLGGFYSLKLLFKHPIQHYISIDKQKSNWSKTIKTNDISCFYNKNKELEKFYTFNWENKNINLFDKNGKMIRSYTPEETKAILRYKHDSRDIHNILRYNKSIKNEKEVKNSIEHLTNIFNTHKTELADKDIIAYRALDKNALKQIKNMKDNSMIFEDPSFISVATKKSSVYQFLNFRNFNNILKIKIPKGSEYLNLDELGHIVVPQLPENELLLKGKLLITKNKGKLEAVFIGNK